MEPTIDPNNWVIIELLSRKSRKKLFSVGDVVYCTYPLGPYQRMTKRVRALV